MIYSLGLKRFKSTPGILQLLERNIRHISYIYLPIEKDTPLFHIYMEYNHDLYHVHITLRLKTNSLHAYSSRAIVKEAINESFVDLKDKIEKHGLKSSRNKKHAPKIHSFQDDSMTIVRSATIIN